MGAIKVKSKACERAFCFLLALALSSIICMSGCVNYNAGSNETQNGSSDSEKNDGQTGSSGDTQPPSEVILSFPNGAPPLNNVAELRCTIRADYANNMTVKINLPDAFEFVSGNLSWSGNLSKKKDGSGTSKTINATIKSVKTGQWIIEAQATVDNPEGEWNYVEGGGRYRIYVSVYEDSASWR